MGAKLPGGNKILKEVGKKVTELNLAYWEDKIRQSQNMSELEDIRVNLLGKQGVITNAMKDMKNLSVDEKKQRGPFLNKFKDDISEILSEKKDSLDQKALSSKLENEKIDITLPCTPFRLGNMHPLSRVQTDIISYFEKLGFLVADAPEIELSENNFDALNVPEYHPARAMQDTFYLSDDIVLRTHTSNVQIHTLKNKKPPLRILAPGRVYRSDGPDATHSPMFFQMEGFVIEEGIHMGHLKATLIDFCRDFFDVNDLPVRFRPSFFPFTEPSAEVDIGVVKEDGRLTIKKGSDWLEVLGCGMIHPRVIKNCGLDPHTHQGFAFGMGIDRLAMLKYGVFDIRDFYHNRTAWLKNFKGVAP